MNDLPEILEQFSRRIEELEKRVHILEHPSEAAAAAALPALSSDTRESNVEQAGNVAYIAASIALFALMLIGVPRAARKGPSGSGGDPLSV